MNEQINAEWLAEANRAAMATVRRNAQEIGAGFPEFARGGKYVLSPHVTAWTNGFWPGMLWLMYAQTGEHQFKDIARECEVKLDPILSTPENLAHDVGFMWSLLSVADYKLTGDDTARRRGLRAAKSLASRYNPMGGYIRSWGDLPGKDTKSWTIADTMMNLPILYWASEVTDDPRFQNMAKCHTDNMIRYMQRPDGSSNHIIRLNSYTGEPIEERQECMEYTQGCGLNSAWTRGQAWMIYGLALGARYTKCGAYLDAAKRSAHYFLASLDDSGVPPIDFRSEDGNEGMDSSAGAAAACGLLEISAQVPPAEKNTYLRGAWKIVKGLNRVCAPAEKNAQNLLEHGATHYDATDTRDVGLIYGDYFYLEALYRLSGGTVIFW